MPDVITGFQGGAVMGAVSSSRVADPHGGSEQQHGPVHDVAHAWEGIR